MRPVSTLCAVPVLTYAETSSGCWKLTVAKSLLHTPMNTPVRLPANPDGACPAFSSASQATSRASRCCGSIDTASRREIPKKAWSNSSTRSRKPPQRVLIFPGRCGRLS